jgi:hypothetical protein
MGIHLAAAIFTFSTRGNAGNQYMITRFEGSDGRTNFGDHPNALVAQNSAWLAGGKIAFENMKIRAANGGLSDLDDGISRGGNLRHGMLFESLFAGAMIHKSLHRGASLLGKIKMAPTRLANDAARGLV